MSQKNKKVVIMYLLWDQEPKLYLEDCIEGLKKQTYPKEDMELLLVYNSHKLENPSQAPYIEETLEKNKEHLPHITFLNQKENLGFSGGNNLGMQWAIDNGFDYVFLHNGDAYMGENCISKLVEKIEEDESIGAAQSLVLLHPETELINTSGNALHYLMMGYGNDYRVNKKDVKLDEVVDVGYISGAAIMMRTDLLAKHGLWREEYFMYHEDTDYSLRLRMQGYRTVMVRDSEFFHKYQFSKSISKYYWMERNRYVLLLIFYKWPTIFVIFPMLLALDIGLIFFSLKGGWFKERMKVYKYWLNYKNYKVWFQFRKGVQKTRKISDRELLKSSVSEILFQEKETEHPLVLYVGNPVLKLYYNLIVRLLVWW